MGTGDESFKIRQKKIQISANFSLKKKDYYFSIYLSILFYVKTIISYSTKHSEQHVENYVKLQFTTLQYINVLHLNRCFLYFYKRLQCYKVKSKFQICLKFLCIFIACQRVFSKSHQI